MNDDGEDKTKLPKWSAEVDGESRSSVQHTAAGNGAESFLSEYVWERKHRTTTKDLVRKEVGKLDNGKALEKLLAFPTSTHHTHHSKEKNWRQ